jgi:uncharacterized cupredoxin-like copper-binding protein
MKLTIKLIAACAIYTGAAAAYAAGAHAGGHGTAAIGQAGDAGKISRSIEIEMSDSMRFTPSQISVKRGETIRFVVKNTGKLKHEFNLGTDKDLKAHYALMLKFPEMEHDEPNIASVAPGGTGEVVWQFTKAGTVSFACLHPGHYDAGMKGKVKVGAAK